MVRHPFGEFALFVGEIAGDDGSGPRPFEMWVNGAEQPRGLGALAKTLSMDLRANDPAWLQLKLDALATVAALARDAGTPLGSLTERAGSSMDL